MSHRATFNGQVIAESDKTESVEDYFPPDSIKQEFFNGPTSLHTTCGWKGVASYADITVDGKTASNAAWYYPEAKSGAKNIEGYYAFYKSKLQVE